MPGVSLILKNKTKIILLQFEHYNNLTNMYLFNWFVRVLLLTRWSWYALTSASSLMFFKYGRRRHYYDCVTKWWIALTLRLLKENH